MPEPPALLMVAIVATGVFLFLWFGRRQRLEKESAAMRSFHTLSKRLLAARTTEDAANIMQDAARLLTGCGYARLYLMNLQSRQLEPVLGASTLNPVPPGVDLLTDSRMEAFRAASSIHLPSIPPPPQLEAESGAVAPAISAVFVPLLLANTNPDEATALGVLEAASTRDSLSWSEEIAAALENLARQAAFVVTSRNAALVQAARTEIAVSAETLFPDAGTLKTDDQSETSVPLQTLLPAHRPASRRLTLMLIDPDAAARRQLLDLLSAREHRVVPIAAEQASDLAHRMRFDAVVWAVRSDGWKWSDYQDRLRDEIPTFILVSSGYDDAFAASLGVGGGFLLSRPVRDLELDRVLEAIETRTAARA